MANRNKNRKTITEQLWVRIMCGFLAVLMVLGTLFYVFATFELRAANESAESEQEIAVGIAYGNNLLPTYTVSCDEGFDVSIVSGKNKTKAFEINSKSISIAANNNLYKNSEGYDYDPDRVTVIGGYHVQISSYSFRIGADGSGDNPVSIFPGGSSGGSLDDLGYTYEEVIAKTKDLNESGILDSHNVYSYPVYNNGKYIIRVGNFDTFEKAQEFNVLLSESISMVSEISEPKDGSVSLIDYRTNKVLMSFFLTEKDNINVEPKNGVSFFDTYSNEYYGHVDYMYSDGKFAVINHLLLEQYLKCILPVTVSASSNMELLKLFAVMLRTKIACNGELHDAYGIDVCTDDHCSQYYGRRFENAAASEAVELTKGEIITYSGKAISPAYCMSAGATTVSGADVFGKEIPYLKAIQNSDTTVNEWTLTMSPSDILNALADAGYTQITSNVSSVKINSRGDGSEYVNSITFTDILGNELTVDGGAAINKAFAYKLPSTAFTVGKAGETVEREVYKNGELIKESITLEGVYGAFVFVGKGSGNGLGVSIQGAKDDVAAGMKYVDIISKYYRDVSITKMS